MKPKKTTYHALLTDGREVTGAVRFAHQQHTEFLLSVKDKTVNDTILMSGILAWCAITNNGQHRKELDLPVLDDWITTDPDASIIEAIWIESEDRDDIDQAQAQADLDQALDDADGEMGKDTTPDQQAT